MPSGRDKCSEAAVRELLAANSVVSLGTVEEDGSPRVTPLFYLARGFRLYWFSSSGSAHSRNLRKRPQASVAVYPSTDEWKQIRGLQMRGVAAPVRNRALRASIGAIYSERFRLGSMFAALLSRSTLYEFKPSWLRYIDNSRRFGYRFELTSFPEIE